MRALGRVGLLSVPLAGWSVETPIEALIRFYVAHLVSFLFNKLKASDNPKLKKNA